MKKQILFLFTIFLFILPPTIASGSHFSNGNDLLEACIQSSEFSESDKKINEFNAGSCWGYIRATNDMYEVMAQNAERKICVSPQIGRKQIIRVVVKYLKEHPERLLNVASLLIYEAFQKAFPCPENQPLK
jgi:hypothetical protein